MTDGCGSGMHTEIGATLGARIVCTEVLRALNGYSLKQQHILFDHTDHWEWREGIPRRVIAKLEAIADSAGAERALFVQDHLLFTIVGVLITPRQTAFFSLGDGLIAVNGKQIPLEQADLNAPPYLAYRMVKTTLSQETLSLHVLHTMPTEQLEHFLLATDGLDHMNRNASRLQPGSEIPIGSIEQFWTDEKYVLNRDAIRRKLAACSTDVLRMSDDKTSIAKYPGLLPDDTTLIVGVRNKNEAP